MTDEVQGRKEAYGKLASRFTDHLTGRLEGFNPPTELPDVRNDLTPVAVDLLAANRDLVSKVESLLSSAASADLALKEEELAHQRTKFEFPLEFMRFVVGTYTTLSEGMALKSKEQEHVLALKRTTDVIDEAVRTWERIVAK